MDLTLAHAITCHKLQGSQAAHSGADLRIPAARPLLGAHGHYASRTSGNSGGRPRSAAPGSQEALDFRKSTSWIRMASAVSTAMKTYLPDVVLALNAAARLAWDEHGSKREISLARQSRGWRGQAPCQPRLALG